MGRGMLLRRVVGGDVEPLVVIRGGSAGCCCCCCAADAGLLGSADVGERVAGEAVNAGGVVGVGGDESGETTAVMVKE